MQNNTAVVMGESFKIFSRITCNGRSSYYIKTKQGNRKLRQGLSDDMSKCIWYITINKVRYEVTLTQCTP